MPSQKGAAQLRFGYWSDPLCIWAFVAQPKLDKLLTEYGAKLDVDYRTVPVFGSVRWRLEEGPWAEAGLSGRVEATRRIAAEHGFPEVDGSCWSRDRPASSWPPCAMLKAVQGLVERGAIGVDRFERYQWQLRRRFFVDNKNISKRSVQFELAEELDLPRKPLESCLDDGTALAKLWEDQHEKERLLLQGSPTYVFDGGRAQLFGNFSFGILHATVAELLRGLKPSGSLC